MTRKLLVVAASGLILAIVLLSAAWAIGGRQMLSAFNHGGWTFIVDDKDGARLTNQFAFDPHAPMTVNAPVDLHFVRGDHVSMTVSGSPNMMRAVQFQDNHLTLKNGPLVSNHALKVEIVAPQMPPLTLAGAGNVSLEHLDQDELHVELSGAGNVEASGRVRELEAGISGAGNLDLAGLSATDATINASGLGNVDVKATGKVAVSLSGAGNVTLHQRPAQLQSSISGLGTVDQDY